MITASYLVRKCASLTDCPSKIECCETTACTSRRSVLRMDNFATWSSCGTMPGMRRSVCMPLMSPANHKTSSPRKMVSGSTVFVTPFAPPSCMAVRNRPGVLTKSTPLMVFPSKAPPATTRMGIANSLKFKSCASANKTSKSSPQVNSDVFSNPSTSLKLVKLVSKLLFDCDLLGCFISLPLKSPFDALRKIPPGEELLCANRLFFVSC